MPDPTLDQILDRQTALESSIEEVRRENAALRARLDRRTDRPAVAAPPRPEPVPTGEGPVGRRHLLRTGLAAAGAAATGAVLLEGRPAAAADQALILGSGGNSATTPTGMAVTGTTADYGFGVSDNGYDASRLVGDPSVLVHARGMNFATGLTVVAEGGASGIVVEGVDGVGLSIDTDGDAIRVNSWSNAIVGASFGATGTALTATSVFGGAHVSGMHHALQLGPTETTRRPPHQDTVAHSVGELVLGERKDVWLCVASGTPGTWRKVGGPAAAGAFHVLPAPARIYDSRPGTAPTNVGPKTPFTPGVARTFDLKANASGVPTGATAALVTLLLVNAANANGNLTIWASGVPKPASNTLVWGGPAGRFTATAVTALDTVARAQVDASARTDLVIDVVGYYR